MTMLEDRIEAADLLVVTMRNGHTITCRFKSKEGGALLVEELDLYGQPIGPNCDVLIVGREISHVRFPAAIDSGAYEQGFAPGQSDNPEEKGEYAEAIQQAKSRYRGNEFSMTSPQQDGLETQRFRPRIEE